MRMSDWSSDVCSSDLIAADRRAVELGEMAQFGETDRLAPGNRAHQRILRDVDATRRQRFVIDRADLAGSTAQPGTMTGTHHACIYTHRSLCRLIQPVSRQLRRCQPKGVAQ